MSVQYGAVGEIVTPTIPLQVELRADGTAYQWLCSGAPNDGSVTAPCAVESRTQFRSTTTVWDGSRWRLRIAAPMVSPDQGTLVPDGSGNILIPYVNPTYSGALFRRVADAAGSDPSCPP
jgi:hypothetical protein